MRPTALYALLAAASMVIIIAGVRAAASIMVPFLLAVFLVILISPIYFWLQRKGAPSWLALVTLILGMVGIGLFGASFVTNAINDFAGNLKTYQKELTSQINVSVEWLEDHGIDIREEVVNKTLDTNALFSHTTDLLRSVSKLLSNGFVIILIAIFILMEAARLPDKIRHLPGMTDEYWQDLEVIVDNVRQYMGMKTVMSALTGVLVMILLVFMGIDYPILLGMLAFVLNFVPSIGSIIAAVPGVLLALVLKDFGDAAIVAIGYVFINVGVSNVLEPRYMGKGLGLSPMIIISTLFLWAWMLGPVGMLLSVPLTMAIKVALEASEKTRGIAYLMSDTVPAPETIPDESSPQDTPKGTKKA